MKIACPSCQRQLHLPDDKVPARPFAVTCPACKGRIEVDPARQTGAASAAPAAPPAAAAASAAAGSADAAGGEAFDPLPPMRELDKELLASIYPVAAVVCLATVPVERYEAGLRRVGIEEVRRFDDLAAAGEAMLESDFAVLLILTDRASAPPCAPLKPLYALPLAVRRRTLVALVADNVRSLDGQTAFYLQVDCLISSQEIAKFPTHLLRALLFHLRLYRYWGVQED